MKRAHNLICCTTATTIIMQYTYENRIAYAGQCTMSVYILTLERSRLHMDGCTNTAPPATYSGRKSNIHNILFMYIPLVRTVLHLTRQRAIPLAQSTRRYRARAHSLGCTHTHARTVAVCVCTRTCAALAFVAIISTHKPPTQPLPPHIHNAAPTQTGRVRHIIIIISS